MGSLGTREKLLMETLNIFVISDSTGETAHQLAIAAAYHFKGCTIEYHLHPHTESVEKVDAILFHAKQCKHAVVVYTIVMTTVREYLEKSSKEASIPSVDLLWPTITTFSRVLGYMPELYPGAIRQMDDQYFKRIEAIEFAVKCDDGKNTDTLTQADIVLIGISRTSKTPLSIFLAHKGYKVANVPIVPGIPLPESLWGIPKEKIIGLTSDPQLIARIRFQRSTMLGLAQKQDYASPAEIIAEMNLAKKTMQKLDCIIINTSNKGIEESASIIMQYIHDTNSRTIQKR